MLATADPRSTAARTDVDQDPVITLVQEELEVADRDAVGDGDEQISRLSDDPLQPLDDLDQEEEEGISIAPEVAALREEFIPSQDYIPRSGEKE